MWVWKKYIVFILVFGLFVASAQLSRSGGAAADYSYGDRVVVPAPFLVVLMAGDRFLAGDLEVMRLAVTGVDVIGVDTLYLTRAQREVARLHPCHEDNYYLANGLLAWGGAVDDANFVLQAAIDCRMWDGVPGFLYAINKSFFENDIDEAVRALELSAQRWPSNSPALMKLAIMLRVESFADERLALDYLTQQRDASRDSKLRVILDKRVVRLQGLVTLREAQRRYEKDNGALVRLNQLIDAGLLAHLPEDPLNLGYELRDGKIILKKMKIAGMED
ncbi:hypothetical protein HNP49_000199 [Pseudomonas fluvialis]|uniref:Tetratricopeptide repeat protein n=1 Tax=Pseudomonas fluvialis TaxID=1793966 RepID=A0A7X0BRQ4_9PSED|nr:hypothetical protein [Pseudomonas fluvialis]MBB6340049.1 hypothetical protein [Pseudomonas fluvialis]